MPSPPAGCCGWGWGWRRSWGCPSWRRRRWASAGGASGTASAGCQSCGTLQGAGARAHRVVVVVGGREGVERAWRLARQQQPQPATLALGARTAAETRGGAQVALGLSHLASGPSCPLPAPCTPSRSAAQGRDCVRGLCVRGVGRHSSPWPPERGGSSRGHHTARKAAPKGARDSDAPLQRVRDACGCAPHRPSSPCGNTSPARLA